MFNHYVQQNGLPWLADSRGFRLSAQNIGPMSPHTIRALEVAGVDFDRQRSPIVLSEQDLMCASRIIALKEAEHRGIMRARFPDWEDRVEYWAIHDIDFAAPDVALVELHEAIRRLVAELR